VGLIDRSRCIGAGPDRLITGLTRLGGLCSSSPRVGRHLFHARRKLPKLPLLIPRDRDEGELSVIAVISGAPKSSQVSPRGRDLSKVAGWAGPARGSPWPRSRDSSASRTWASTLRPRTSTVAEKFAGASPGRGVRSIGAEAHGSQCGQVSGLTGIRPAPLVPTTPHGLSVTPRLLRRCARSPEPPLDPATPRRARGTRLAGEERQLERADLNRLHAIAPGVRAIHERRRF
jgi:hypothetical protein